MRDLLDLAMMTPHKELLSTAIAEAQVSYGNSAEDLVKAVEALTQLPHRLDRCTANMGMDTLCKAALRMRIRALVS